VVQVRCRQFCPNRLDPIPEGLGNKFWFIVRPNISGHTSQDEQASQSIYDLVRIQFPVHPDRQAFPAVFIQDIERTMGSAIICAVVYAVIRLDVVTILRMEMDTRSVMKPERAFLWLFH
jgi:hypothetical protein